jgi:DNA processing protein
MLGMKPTFGAGPGFIAAVHPSFPRRFADLPVPPGGLWFEGRLPDSDAGLVAVVGSRAASRAGTAQVHALASGLAVAGWSTVSGGALGIDAAAHLGTLAGGGSTFAVLGCGIDVVYPDRHTSLFRRIVQRGGLLSEYGPGQQPRKGQFPVRNRLVAALANTVLVGESRRGSGALITARLAARLGRPLLAIPGSAGTDELLMSGAAAPVESVRDVLEALAGRRRRALDERGPAAAVLRALRATGAATAERVAAHLGAPLPEVLSLLCEAELNGQVARSAGGKFEVPGAH